MQWLKNNKRRLMVIAVTSSVAEIACLYYLVNLEYMQHVETWQISLYLIPWVIFTLSFLPLIYLFWFKSAKPGLMTIC